MKDEILGGGEKGGGLERKELEKKLKGRGVKIMRESGRSYRVIGKDTKRGRKGVNGEK